MVEALPQKEGGSGFESRFPPQFYVSTALFSSCRTWRYSLIRAWDAEKPFCNFVGLNPSTADEVKNDPTVTRCIKYAHAWGFGGLIMTNIFAFRSTDPRRLKEVADPVGPENNTNLVQSALLSGLTVAAWGVHGRILDRHHQVLGLFKQASISVHCLGATKEGYPRHPLYLSRELRPERYETGD